MNRRRLLWFAGLVPSAAGVAALTGLQGAVPPTNPDEDWLRTVLDWQHGDPQRFLDALRLDVGMREIYVFTPKHDAVVLPIDATPVDFAYAIHTDVGHRCTSAVVNGRAVALDMPLRNGDTVRIISGERAQPHPEWLRSVKTSRARAKITARLGHASH